MNSKYVIKCVETLQTCGVFVALTTIRWLSFARSLMNLCDLSSYKEEIVSLRLRGFAIFIYDTLLAALSSHLLLAGQHDTMV